MHTIEKGKWGTGRVLNKEWQVGARQALYSRTGTWYMPLEHFPGALFDANGYVLFESKRSYENCRHLHRGVRLSVPNGIARIPGYVNRAQPLIRKWARGKIVLAMQSDDITPAALQMTFHWLFRAMKAKAILPYPKDVQAFLKMAGAVQPN